jgi:hypothetical protein
MPVTQNKWLFSRFCIWLRGCEEPIWHTSAKIEDVRWCDWHYFAHGKTEHHLSSFGVSVIISDGISMLLHFRTKNCDSTASVSQILELRFSCLQSHHSFCPVTSGTSVDHSTFINITEMFVDIYLNVSWQQGIVLQHVVCTVYHCSTSLWGAE